MNSSTGMPLRTWTFLNTCSAICGVCCCWTWPRAHTAVTRQTATVPTLPRIIRFNPNFMWFLRMVNCSRSIPFFRKHSSQIAANRSLDILIELHATVIIEGQDLHHDHCGNLPVRIDPEVRVVNSRPGVAARRTQVWILCIRGRDLKSESEFVAPGADREVLRSQWVSGGLSLNDHITDLILRHRLN